MAASRAASSHSGALSVRRRASGATSVEGSLPAQKSQAPSFRFGGKEGLCTPSSWTARYRPSFSPFSPPWSRPSPRLILGLTLGLLDYIRRNFGRLPRAQCATPRIERRSRHSIMGDVAARVRHIIAAQFKRSNFQYHLVAAVRTDARRPHRRSDSGGSMTKHA